MWPAFPAPEYYGGSAPPGPFSGRRAYPRRPGRMPERGEPAPGGSRVHRDSLVGVGARLCPSGSPWLRRSPSPWPPRSAHRRPPPGSSLCFYTHQDTPRPARIRQVRAGSCSEGRNDTGSSRTPLRLARRTPPSGSPRTSRLCQDRSRPPRHHPGQTVLSYSDLLRQATGEGLSPPLEPQHLTAHVEKHRSPSVADADLGRSLHLPGASLCVKATRHT